MVTERYSFLTLELECRKDMKEKRDYLKSLLEGAEMQGIRKCQEALRKKGFNVNYTPSEILFALSESSEVKSE